MPRKRGTAWRRSKTTVCARLRRTRRRRSLGAALADQPLKRPALEVEEHQHAAVGAQAQLLVKGKLAFYGPVDPGFEEQCADVPRARVAVDTGHGNSRDATARPSRKLGASHTDETTENADAGAAHKARVDRPGEHGLGRIADPTDARCCC